MIQISRFQKEQLLITTYEPKEKTMPKITLTNDQKAAVKAFVDFLFRPNEKYFIIQGSAGSGKSTLIKVLHDTIQAQYKMYALLLQGDPNEDEFETVLTATTNKAALVLEELTDMPATTIHQFLNITVTYNKQTGRPRLVKKKNWGVLYNKLVIVDEASMVGEDLYRLLDETTENCKVILIGDQYQLSPITESRSVMETLPCSKVIMNQVMRHGGIIKDISTQFRDTVETKIFKNIPDVPAVKHVDGPTFQALIDQAFTDKNYSLKSAKILAWTNDIIHAYNSHIRKLKGFPEMLSAGETVFTNNPIRYGDYHRNVDSEVYISKVGDPSISYGVHGRIVELNKAADFFLPNNPYEVKALLNKLAKDSKWSEHYAIKNTWLDLRPAYASTVHKAQGSSYDTVFINLSDIGRCTIASETARLLYVAISRAVKQIYFYGKLPARYCEAV